MSAEVESTWIGGGLTAGQDDGRLSGSPGRWCLICRPWPPRSPHPPWAGAALELPLSPPFLASISLPFRPPMGTPVGSPTSCISFLATAGWLLGKSLPCNCCHPTSGCWSVLTASARKMTPGCVGSTPSSLLSSRSECLGVCWR